MYSPGSAPTPQDVSNPSQYQSGHNGQPLSGSSYNQSGPSGPPSSMSAYHTSSNSNNPPTQRLSNDERVPTPQLPVVSIKKKRAIYSVCLFFVTYSMD